MAANHYTVVGLCWLAFAFACLVGLVIRRLGHGKLTRSEWVTFGLLLAPFVALPVALATRDFSFFLVLVVLASARVLTNLSSFR